MKTNRKGFTLIELLIVITILGILASVAYPTYQNQVKRGYCADAQGALQGLASAMERFRSTNLTYVGTHTSNVPIATLYPSEAPLDGGNKLYDLRITAADATSFTVQAIPQSGGAMNGTGRLQLNSTGARGWDEDNNNSFAGSEWNNWDACR